MKNFAKRISALVLAVVLSAAVLCPAAFAAQLPSLPKDQCVVDGAGVLSSSTVQTITELNATVGSVCSGTVATIQDLSSLTVEVTIPASSVSKLSTGMQCSITSDATGDTAISGTLTRIDPVADENGSFGATVSVNGSDSGLLIGISAQVEIVVRQDEDVFTVPRDAIGTREDGSTVTPREANKERQEMILTRMAGGNDDVGVTGLTYLTKEEAEAAKAEELHFTDGTTSAQDIVTEATGGANVNSWFVDQVLRDVSADLADLYGITEKEALNRIYNSGIQHLHHAGPEDSGDCESVYEDRGKSEQPHLPPADS